MVTEAGITCGNPCSVVERETGAIWLPFCKNLADGDEIWQLGGDVEVGANACAIAPRQDGSLYINCRNFVRGTQRAVARGDDQGNAFTDFDWAS